MLAAMNKSIIIIVFLSLAGYVASLTCLKCYNPKSCLTPSIETCLENVKYCASLEFRKVYGKGCMERADICQQKSNHGQGFDHCSICSTDNFSSLKCLSCDNENKCLNSASKACAPKQNVCFSSVVQNLPPPYGEVEYYRGCSDEDNICKTILEWNFGRCYQCDSNNCNNHTLKYKWSDISSTKN